MLRAHIIEIYIIVTTINITLSIHQTINYSNPAICISRQPTVPLENWSGRIVDASRVKTTKPVWSATPNHPTRVVNESVGNNRISANPIFRTDKRGSQSADDRTGRKRKIPRARCRNRVNNDGYDKQIESVRPPQEWRPHSVQRDRIRSPTVVG